MTSATHHRLRLATLADIPALEVLIPLSVRQLQAADYSPAQIEAALGRVFGVDTLLIQDGTYYVIEAASNLIACGGWSKRQTLFGPDNAAVREPALLNPATGAARIRAFFVHPSWARRGLGTQLLTACESAAVTAGFRRFELGATLTGEPLYRRHGYFVIERLDVPLPGAHPLAILRMTKSLAPAGS